MPLEERAGVCAGGRGAAGADPGDAAAGAGCVDAVDAGLAEQGPARHGLVEEEPDCRHVAGEERKERRLPGRTGASVARESRRPRRGMAWSACRAKKWGTRRSP